MIKEDLVTIAKYGDSQEASLAKAMLESQGITGLVVGGEINSMLWHLGSTISGVELQVPSSEAARAGEMLESFLDTRRSQTKGEGIHSPIILTVGNTHRITATKSFPRKVSVRKNLSPRTIKPAVRSRQQLMGLSFSPFCFTHCTCC